jgi:hypothetical protein
VSRSSWQAEPQAPKARAAGGILRTNVSDWTSAELWRTYVQLTEAEAAFRIHKGDLSIRPIWLRIAPPFSKM